MREAKTDITAMRNRNICDFSPRFQFPSFNLWNKETENQNKMCKDNSNNTVDQLDLTDNYRTLPQQQQSILSLCTQRKSLSSTKYAWNKSTYSLPRQTIKQVSINLKEFKSYQVCFLTTVELNQKSTTQGNLRNSRISGITRHTKIFTFHSPFWRRLKRCAPKKLENKTRKRKTCALEYRKSHIRSCHKKVQNESYPQTPGRNQERRRRISQGKKIRVEHHLVCLNTGT